MEKKEPSNSDPLPEVEEEVTPIQKSTNEVQILPKSTQFRLAPSTIGHYFHLSCDRFLAFKTSGIDSVRWCFKEGDAWKTYTREESVWIEMAQLNNEKKITLSNDRTIVFATLTETKKSKDQDPSETKPVRRGVWFFENEKKSLVPLPDNLIAELEEAKKSEEKLAKLAEEFKTVEGMAMKINIKGSTVTVKKEDDKLVELKLQRGLSGEDDVKDVIGKAHIDSGEVWEETLVQKILKEKGHQVFTATSKDQLELKLSAQKIDYQEFISILKTFKYDPIEGKRYFIYQPTVIIPQDFYEKFNVPSYKVTFSNCYPDFMELKWTESGGVELIVVDAKASPKMKLSHRIQVAMYALYLEEVFKKESITNITISTNGGVWIRPNEDYTLFDLTPVKHVLQEFLNCNNMDSKLRLILNTALHEVPYHLNKRCSGCPYLPICEGQSNNSLDLSLVKGITKQRKQFMVDFLQKLDQSSVKKSKKYPAANSMEKKSIKRLKVYDIEDCHQLLGELFPKSPASFLDIKPKEKPKKRTPTKAKADASEPTTPAKIDINQQEFQTPVKSTGTDPVTPSTPQNSNTNVPLSPTTPFELRETIGSATNTQVWMTRKEKPTEDVNYENLPQSVKLELWDLKCKVDAWMSKDIVFYNTAAPTMTCESDISVAISVVSDPPSGSLCGWFVHFSITTKSFVKEGLLNVLAEKVLALNDLTFVDNVKIDGTNSVFVYDMATKPSAPNAENILLLENRFVKTLYACLSVLSLYNTKYRDEEEKKGKKPSEINKKLIKTQFFTFDSSEYYAVKKLLFQVAARPDPFPQEMANELILTLIHSTDVLFNKKQPDFDSTPDYPVVVLKKEIDSVVSVPLPFNAEFSEFVASFGGDREAALNSKEILASWYLGFPLEEVAELFRKRAETLQSLVFAFEKTIEERNVLVMPKATPPFFMRTAMDFQHPLLSKLAFVVKFEQYIAGAKRSNTRSNLLTTMLDKTLVSDRVLIVKLHEDEKKVKAEVPVINAPVPVEIPEDLSSSKSPTAKVLRPRRRSTKTEKDELNSDPASSQDSSEVKVEAAVEVSKEKSEDPANEASQQKEHDSPMDQAKLDVSWVELQVIFPEKDPNELKALLVANQGQLQLVIESLLGESGPAPEISAPVPLESDEKTPVKAAPKKRAVAGSAKKRSTPASRAKKSTSTDETSEAAPAEEKSNSWVRFDVVDFSENLRIEVDRAIGTYNWLIARVDERGVKDLLKYNDFVNREKWGPAFGTTVAFAKIENIDERNKTIGVTAKFQAYASGVFSPDCHYIMTERHADLLSKYVLETLKEVDLIDELQKIIKPVMADKQLIAWLENACFELAVLPKKDKATLLIPAEFKEQMNLLRIPLKFVAQGKKKSDEDDPGSTRFASELPDISMHYRAIYLAIQELQGIITTSGLYLQLLEDPLVWGRNSPEGKEAVDSPSSKKALQLVEEVTGGLFTEAQAKVFKQVVNKKLQLIWGPPGTGKTHFLATTVVLMAEAHRFARSSPIEAVEETAPEQPEEKPLVSSTEVKTVTGVEVPVEKPAQVDSKPELEEKKQVVENKPEETKVDTADTPKPETEVVKKDDISTTEEKKEVVQEKPEEKKDEPMQIKTEEKKDETSQQDKSEEKKDEPMQIKTEEKKDEPAQEKTNTKEEPVASETKPKPASAKGRKPKAVAPEESNSPAPKGDGQDFKVLVVGFTHSSIDNLINKILDMVSEFDKVKRDKSVEFKLPVARLVKRDADTSDMPESANFELLKAENAATVLKWLNNNVQCVLGGTIWAVRKVFKERFNQPPRFHMVIVDEASQMLLADAYHPLRYLLSDEGRLILAGDDQQLPPIINGEYPELPRSEPVLFSSIFNAFRHKDVNQECTSMLIENWRMNQSLVELPSNTIYKTSDPKMKYHAANDRIATQSFPLKKLKDDQFYYINKGIEATETVSHPLLKLFLDGESPLVVVLLKVDTYSEIGSFPHSDLIAAFTSAVRKAFKKAEGTTEENLWREKLHIVAPHHIQRQAIFNSIYGSKKWNQEWHKEAEPFIETVEKTQGREVDCTIVDYGLLNTSQIKNELRFIYSRPRLNVSLTRAKKKCLVVVSDILLSAAIEHIFDSKETEHGFTHFQNLIAYAREKNSLYNLALSELPATIKELEKDPFFM